MGQTDRQVLWRVEVPLATPEIIAGLRIATVSTVAIATLAAFAGGGGLGRADLAGRDRLQDQHHHRRRDRDPDGARLRRDPAHDPAPCHSLGKGGPGVTAFLLPRLPLGSIQGALEFIFEPQPSNVTGGKLVGGFDQTLELALTQLEVTVFALALSMVLALPARPLPRPQGGRRAAGGRPRQRRAGDPRAGPDRLHGGGDRRRHAQPDDRARRARHPADPHQRLRRHPPGRPRPGRGGPRDRDDRARDPASRSRCRSRSRP